MTENDVAAAAADLEVIVTVTVIGIARVVIDGVTWVMRLQRKVVLLASSLQPLEEVSGGVVVHHPHPRREVLVRLQSLPTDPHPGRKVLVRPRKLPMGLSGNEMQSIGCALAMEVQSCASCQSVEFMPTVLYQILSSVK